MTDEQIQNLYLETTGKAEGIAEITGSANFPVLFARAVLKLDKMQRRWTGLSEDDVSQAMFRANAIVTGPTQFKFAKEIEAKLKEKNT